MSFGGGGGSTTGVNAHLHTSASGSGGSLDSTSLINDAPLFSLMVAL
tara:strand:+ start:332 stop:472 length:141 start_codon:yes stop_codon:yes gene_type:complete